MTHICVDCLALPERPVELSLGEEVLYGPEFRPARPRPAPHGGPRSRRCTTHQRAHRNAQRLHAAVVRVTRVYRLSAKEQAELWAFQGERCPCGRKPTRRPDTDHDHACCPGPTSCGACVRGMCCRACNKDVLGRYSATQLRALADYLDNPPAARMRAARLKETG